MPKFVYDFTEGNKDLKDLLGGKGANLAEMTNLGLPVPPGFTITTDACRHYLAEGTVPDGLDDEVTRHLQDLETAMGRKLGDSDDPLLVSVRSGAKFSMPGMMDTVLNVGLSDQSVEGLAKQSGNVRFAWDAYRRLIQMFGKTVLGIDGAYFERAIDAAKQAKGVTSDTELNAEDLKTLTARYKNIVVEQAGREFPQDPREQMDLAVMAVFNSWNSDRAVLYRRQERIPSDLGTAVSVVAMVFGNLGDDSGTGVAFTRDPGTGAQGVYGDYLQNAQGEDVVAGRSPQLKAAVAELKGQGFALPDFPDEPKTDEERDVRARYDKIKGSAVNPVLREGNSDRRASASVKNYAKAHPHRMGAWSSESKTEVATMGANDFRSTEKSATVAEAADLRIEHVAGDGSVTVLRGRVPVLAGEVVDASVMHVGALREFLTAQIAKAKADGVLFSVHLKATMMKVSDPIIFGHVVRAFFPKTFAAFGADLAAAGLSPNDGLGAILGGLAALPNGEQIKASFDAELAEGPALAMVDSDRGITNLHVPSDVIVDASMPAMIRTSGHMWGPDGKEGDTLAVLPDSSYSGVYETVIEDCKAHGAFDPATMGSVPNVGLMAQKAEEYGSHDKTFELATAGAVRVVNAATGAVVLEQAVEAGDVFRMSQTKDLPIRDWVKLAVTRARATGDPAVFWLDADRAHDAQLIKKVGAYLPEHDTEGLTIEVLAPVEATAYSLERIRRGENTISVTGNVLRDYLTDLFPILELGTSAKMLSVVPLMNGGGLFETGAGGSAPKHVQQLVKEDYLRWDSLGEFLALAVSFEHYAQTTGNAEAKVLADTLDRATATFLNEDKSPSRKLGGIDNRGSHFYLALYWAQELAAQTGDAHLAEAFKPLAETLAEQEGTIVDELNAVQGQSVDLGGYYRPDAAKASVVMRPSATFNKALEQLAK